MRLLPRPRRVVVALAACCLLSLVAAGPVLATFIVMPKGSPLRYIVAMDDEVETLEGATYGGERIVWRNDPLNHVVVETHDPTTLLAALAGDPRVRYVELDEPNGMRALWSPNDPRYGEQYGLSRIRAASAWDVTRGSTSVIVAVGDSGVDSGHPDLGRLLPTRDFTGQGTTDSCGHGTHVTGIAGATTNNGVGMAGVAQATILPVKVIKSNCAGSFSQIASGITWAADQGADVISLSLGCRGCTSSAVIDAVRYATNTRGALVVVAAGNSGCGGCVNFPATLPEVLAVACTTSTDSLCSFSSRGPEVDIAAPGQSILSTERGGGYGLRSGTSMSAPHVAGAAALILAKEPGLSVSALRNRLLSTAKDLSPAGEDDSTGAGLLDLAAALGASSTGGSQPTPPPTNPGPSGPVLVENFDDGAANGWSLSGLWRVGGGCLGTKSEPASLQYNDGAGCTFNTGARTSGGAQVQVDLSKTGSPKLSFDTRHTVESYASGSYDRLRVLASTNGGATWSTLWTRDSRTPNSGWTEVTLDLTAQKSSATLVRFDFDSIDSVANAFPGWAVDNVRIE